MNWISHYVQAVVSKLPKKEQNDVAEELTSLLEEEAEEHFSLELSRIPPENLKQWLQEKEHPSIAAVAYQKRHNLIEESTYPLYRLAIRNMAIILGILWLLVVTTRLMTLDHTPLLGILWQSLWSYVHLFLVGFAMVTLVFHLASSQFDAKSWHKGWKLEPIPSSDQKWRTISYSTSIFNILTAAIAFAWLAGWTEGTLKNFFDGIQTLQPRLLTPALNPYYPWFFGLLLATIVFSFANLMQPHLRVWSLTVSALISLISAVLLVRVSLLPDLINWNPLLHLQDTHMDLDRLLAHLQDVTTMSIRLAAVVNLFEFGKAIFRVAKIKQL